MGRSVQLKPELIQQVKNALHANNFPSQQALANHLGLSRCTVNKFFNSKPVDYLNALEICETLNLNISEVILPTISKKAKKRVNWGEATDTFNHSVRVKELKTLKKKIVTDNCRVVLIEGMKGMGKTNLSYRLGKQIENHFDFVIWRSLDQYNSINELLIELLTFFKEEEEIKVLSNVVENWKETKKFLEINRCLVILTNIDLAIIKYSFKSQIPCYEESLNWLIKKQSKSCLIMTSNIEPQEIDFLIPTTNQSIHRLKIQPLPINAIQDLFNDIGSFSGSKEDWLRLQKIYSGNPFVLRNIALHIHKTFGGNITNFFAFGLIVFNGVERYLDLLLQELQYSEKNVMYWLAIHRHPINIFELRDIVSGLFGDQLLIIIRHLKQRFFIEEGEGEGILILPPMIREYFVKRLITEISNEIINQKFSLLLRFPLLITTATSIVRKDEIKFILKPVIADLKVSLGTNKNIETKLKEILNQQRIQSNHLSGYLSGNIVNLIGLVNTDFNNQNFSNLILKNTNFQDTELHNTDFSNTDLSGSILLNSFSNVLSVDCSSDGSFVAIGDTSDQIYIWKVTENRPILKYIMTSHNYWVRCISFSHNSEIIACGGEDGNVYLREVKTEKDIIHFEGHISRVRSLSFSYDDKFIASSSDDQTIRIYDLNTNKLFALINEHKDKIRSVIFHPNSNILVSASQDNQVCVFKLDCNSVSLQNTFQLEENNSYLLRTIALSPDGKTLVSGSDDGMLRFWNLDTGTFIRSFEKRHTNWIRSIQFSQQGDKIASAGEDKKIYIWDTNTGKCLHSLEGHRGRIWSVSFHPSRSWLVSGGDGLTVKFWDTDTGECLRAFRGYSQEIRPIKFSPNGLNLATGNNNATVNLQDSSTGENLHNLKTLDGNIWSFAYSPDGHTLIGASDNTTIKVWNILLPNNYPTVLTEHSNWVRTIAYSSDGNLIASGSDDKTVKLWDARTFNCLHTFDIHDGHKDWVRSICFHPKKPILISGSDDGTIKFWDIKAYKLIKTLQTDQQQIWTISINGEGTLLASGSNDNTIKIWDLESCELLITLKEHRKWISSIAFSPDGRWLASASYDTTIRLWELSSGQYKCEKILYGHEKAIVSIDFHPKELILASTSKDGTIKQWNLEKGEYFKSWQSPLPYENANISNVTGLTSAEKLCLKTLGANEKNST